ncbi:MAG: hypothetical protein ACRC7S_04370 [Cetobacterium sp.]
MFKCECCLGCGSCVGVEPDYSLSIGSNKIITINRLKDVKYLDEIIEKYKDYTIKYNGVVVNG